MADLGRAGWALAAAAVAAYALPTPPFWYGPTGTAARWLAAAALGVAWCLALSSSGRLRVLLDNSRALARATRAWTGAQRIAAQTVWEEALWRGVLLATAAALFGYLPALVVTAALFGTWHAYQGVRGVVVNTGNGLLFGATYGYLGNLPAAVLTHLGYNLALAWTILGRQTASRTGP